MYVCASTVIQHAYLPYSRAKRPYLLHYSLRACGFYIFHYLQYYFISAPANACYIYLLLLCHLSLYSNHSFIHGRDWWCAICRVVAAGSGGRAAPPPPVVPPTFWSVGCQPPHLCPAVSPIYFYSNTIYSVPYLGRGRGGLGVFCSHLWRREGGNSSYISATLFMSLAVTHCVGGGRGNGTVVALWEAGRREGMLM